MKNTYYFYFLSILLLIACNPDDRPKASQVDGDTVCEFAPYTTGSVFRYVPQATFIFSPFSMTVLGDTTIDGEQWKIIQSIPGRRKYVNCRFPYYSEMYLTPGADRDSLVLPFLKLDAAEGSSWGFEYTEPPIATYRFELLSKGKDHTTAQGVTYKDVSEVMLESWKGEPTLQGGVFVVDYTRTLHYFSPDAGLIEYAIGGPITGYFFYSLESYTIE